MNRKKSTSIVLSKAIQVIKDKYAGLYGLKDSISAGFILLHKLSADERENLIEQIRNDEEKLKNEEQQGKTQPAKDIEVFKKSAAKLIALKSKDFTTLLPFLTEQEKQALKIMREEFGTEKSKEKLKNA